MRNLTENKTCGDLAEEQPCQKKPTLIRPLPLRASANVPLGAGSSFLPWKKPSGNINYGLSLGVNAEAGSSAIKPYHQQLATTSINMAPAENGNDHNIENYLTPISEENLNIIGGAATFGDVNDGATAKNDEGLAYQPGLDCSNKPEMDPRRLNRIMANRISAQKSRLKKNAYVADLESKAKSFKNNISLLYRQIAAHKNGNRLLHIEQHQLKLRMAACEKQRILQEDEIEKKRAEVDRLKELQKTKSAGEAQTKMLNLGASVHLMSNSGLGGLVCKNYSHQETSKMQVDTAQQSQNQSQMRIAKWENRRRTFPNLNIVKSEPES